MVITATEALGPKIRRQRRKLGLTLDELAGRTGISKPYLSLIETGRVSNPPSDEKLRRLEQSLGFAAAELVGQAHLQRTPLDVRAMLVKLAGNTGTASMAIPVGEGVSGSGEPLYGAISMLSETVGWPDVRGRETIAGRVGDDSMAPMYRRGDIVIFAPDQAPQSGEDAYVRLVDGRVVFVRIFFETDEQGGAVVRLQPRNSKNRAVTYPGEQIAAAYGAVYRYQRVEGE